jgi:hypothetical protein
VFWPHWKDALVIVKPDTVIRWHRKGFRLYWRAIWQRWMTFLRNHKNVIVFGEQHLRRLLRNHVVYYNAWREAA